MTTQPTHSIDEHLSVSETAVQRPAKPRARRPAAKSSAAYAAGLDVGYAYVKWLAADGTRELLPTAVAPLDLDGGPAGRTRPGDTVITLDGTAYLVGHGAIWSGRRLSDHLRWDTWWQSIPYRAVLLALAERVPPGAVLVTGVPLSVPLTPALSEPIERVLKQTLKARQVLVTQQGAAAAVALDLLDQDSQIGLIDIGGRTTEFVTIRYGRIHTARCTGLRLGVCALYDTLAADCHARWNWEVDGYVIEQLLRGALPAVRLGPDQATVIRDLQDRLRVAAAPLADQLLATCRSLWQDGRWLDQVILCGGGAELFAEPLRRWRGDLVLAEDRQWLNVRGYLRLASDLVPASGADPAANGEGR
ncbi:ParM/StbA family protein [Nitrospira calida]|jgi:hypothetical protein